MAISKDYTNGVSLSIGDAVVTIMPALNACDISSSISTAPMVITTASSGAVTFENYFGDGVDVKYTPLHSGVSKSIILSTYPSTNEYQFTLSTGGLGVYEENVGYYIAQDESANMRIDISKIATYDNMLKMTQGTLSVMPIKENQLYQLTVPVDEAFLANAATVYPVSIYPSFTVSDTTHGTGAIFDSPVYSGLPNSNFGNYVFNRAGYADSTYQIGRTAIKIPALSGDPEYSDLSAEAVESAEFYVTDSSGSSQKTVNIYALTSNSTWTESSLTWNMVGTIPGTLQA